METLNQLKVIMDKAKQVWGKVAPLATKVGPNGAWFAAGFAAAKLVSCLLS